MSMTRSEFNMAFSTVIEEEFANIPDESEIEVEFSDEFNRKMQELIDSIGANDGQKPSLAHFTAGSDNLCAYFLDMSIG